MCHIGTKQCWGQQNTHWYRVTRKNKAARVVGYSANPIFADPGEIERIGKHDCFELQCWRHKA
jgi:hypothetical protein